MKPKKFNQLMIVMEIFDECGSTVRQFQSELIQGKKHKKLRQDMAKILEQDMKRLHDEILKL